MIGWAEIVHETWRDEWEVCEGASARDLLMLIGQR